MAEVFYHPLKGIKCPDGVNRTVRARAYYREFGRVSLYPDTAFSIPAYVKVRGKTVRGYITPSDGMAFMQEHEPAYEFHATTCHKNHGVFAG